MNNEQLVSLVHQHQAGIYRYLRYLGASRELAEDLGQETFVVAFDKGGQVTGGQGAVPVAWLRSVARNLFLVHCRRQRNSPVRIDSETLDHAEAAWAVEFASGGDGGEHLAALRHCLEHLPPKQRLIVDLQYAQKKSRAEIAAMHGMTEDGVKTLMRRLRASLAQCVRGQLGAGEAT